MAVVTMRQLLEAGIHFGHQTRRWNPKMARFIFGQRNGIYIIDLQKTARQLDKAYNFVRDTVASGGTVLFVGTKKQAQEPVAREAERCGMYYVNNRWLGGTLTNWETIRHSIRTLHKLEEMETSGAYDKMPKKEVAKLRKEYQKLDKNLRGVKNMTSLPSVMFVIDARKEHIAVREAERLNIPCIAVVDTNCDPDVVPLPIPGNDDAIRAVSLFCRVIADAAIEGRSHAEKLRSEERARQEQARQQRTVQRRAPAESDTEQAPSDEAAPAAEAPAAETPAAETPAAETPAAEAPAAEAVEPPAAPAEAAQRTAE
jgi:small subunit ribosomal protein S2